jgi:hypothetical protein
MHELASADYAVDARRREFIPFRRPRRRWFRTDQTGLGESAGQSADRLWADVQEPCQSHAAGPRIAGDRSQSDVLPHRYPERAQRKVGLLLEQVRS